jgi:DNA-binding XRE family transcriptional regulator
MTSRELVQFRCDHGWSQRELAEKIGVSRISLRKYETLPNSIAIPLSVSLACSCLAWGLPPFGEKVQNEHK